jgi:hypothetical protein
MLSVQRECGCVCVHTQNFDVTVTKRDCSPPNSAPVSIFDLDLDIVDHQLE